MMHGRLLRNETCSARDPDEGRCQGHPHFTWRNVVWSDIEQRDMTWKDVCHKAIDREEIC